MQATKHRTSLASAEVNIVDVRVEAFKRGRFGFVTTNKRGRHEKQEKALGYLTDKITEEFLYGGAAGGAKSWTGCVWLIFMCLLYPGTRWFIAREELKRLRKSTLVTFFKAASFYGVLRGIDFIYNVNDSVITFSNGSTIDLLDIAYMPKDPEFERFGSMEYTGGWIEEAGETHFGAYDVLKSRIGRHLNEQFGLIGKLYLTCNPKKNWLYTEFYLPAKKGLLEAHKKYLVALAQDNVHGDPGYIARLSKIKDRSKRERLFYGNWEYDDDPNSMLHYDNIIAIYKNNQVQRTGVKYLVCDVARFGSDKARICVFDGWVLIEYFAFDISSTVQIEDCILAMRVKHNIPAHQCVGDEDGVGGGVIDHSKIIGFVNNSKPIPTPQSKENPLNAEEREDYENLKTQCAYGLADVIRDNGFYFAAEIGVDEQEVINTELSWLKTYKTDEAKKLRIIPKAIIKEAIGRSPDWLDCFIMRYYFELAQYVIRRAKSYY